MRVTNEQRAAGKAHQKTGRTFTKLGFATKIWVAKILFWGPATNRQLAADDT